MSDYNNPNNYDKYGNPIPGDRPLNYEPAQANGRAPYVLLGLLVLVGIVGGAMYLTPHKGPSADVATAPPAATDTMRTAPAPMTPPTATTPAPATTITPAPAAPTTTQQ